MQMNKDGMVTIRSAITSIILAVWWGKKRLKVIWVKMTICKGTE